MRFPAPLIPATLIRRYKRFLADVVLGSGETLTVHVANPGSMIGLSTPGARVYVSKSENARRKLSRLLAERGNDDAVARVAAGQRDLFDFSRSRFQRLH